MYNTTIRLIFLIILIIQTFILKYIIVFLEKAFDNIKQTRASNIIIDNRGRQGTEMQLIFVQ